MNSLEELLEHYFGFTEFRPGQKEVISSLLAGQHLLAMLPTGTGKSLCYQLPTYALKKPTLIVSPLLSLMQDQAEQLKVRGEKRVLTFNSFLTLQQKKEALSQLSSFRFIFISPEMLALDYVIRAIQQIEIGLFVIDEAHCISQWGYDFRPDYLNLGEARQKLGEPLTLALTATATEEVRKDIIEKLEIKDMKQIVSTVDRHNIALFVEKLSRYEEKLERLLQLVQQFSGSGIIYFSSKKAAESVSEYLHNQGVNRIAYYHGGMEPDQRMLIQQQFITGQLQIICATSAFGMGVNKPDIRFVIHFHLPATMESYVQEIGRAGRDGEQSAAVLLYSDGDEGLPLHLMEQQLPTDAQIEGVHAVLLKSGEGMMDVLKPMQEQLCHQFSLNEVQFRMIAQFLATKQDVAKPIELFKQYCHTRKSRHAQKLEQLLQWVKDSTCRRLGIVQYFEESQAVDNPVCCDCCGMSIEQVMERWPRIVERQQADSFYWKRELASILSIKGTKE